jgi:hypothetical protein
MFHRFPLCVLLVCACAIGAARPAAAGDLQEAALPARAIQPGDLLFAMPDVAEWQQRIRDAEQWVADYQEWQQWNVEWRNRREPGWMGARERRVRPNPPLWLEAECRDAVLDADGVLAEACRLLVASKDDDGTALLRAQIAAAQAKREAERKTVWWEHVHFDALWPMTQVGDSVYGVVGMHATIEVAGRLQIFVAPGAILLNLPRDGSSREWRPATDWGFAYRLTDFTLPGVGRPATLHINFAKAWLLGGPGNLAQTSVNLAGFSITMSRQR